MPEFRRNHNPRATRSMIAVLVGVAVFALVFIGVMAGLNSIAPYHPGSPGDRQQRLGPAEWLNYTAEELYVPIKPFHILLIGSDSRKGTALYTGKANEHAQLDQHADVITLVRVDPITYTVTFVTIPRDSVLKNNGPKINDSLLGNDPTEVVEAVAQLTGVRCEFYMMVTFTAFEQLVDSLGGVAVDVPTTITVPDPSTGNNVTVKAGKNQKLTGSQALVLARARKEYQHDEDALRQVNVRNIEKALVQKLISKPNIVDVHKAIDAVLRGVSTNMSLPQATSLLRDFSKHAGEITFYECTGPYAGGVRTSDDLWVVTRAPETWAQLMALVEAGEDPSKVVPVPKL